MGSVWSVTHFDQQIWKRVFHVRQSDKHNFRMPVRKIESLNIWEVGHGWEAVDPDAAPAGCIAAEVRDRLRQLVDAVTTAINPYEHGEIAPTERL